MAPNVDKNLSQTPSLVFLGSELSQFDETIELATVIASMDGEHAAPRPVQPMEPARLGIEGDDTATDESTNPTLPPSPLSLALLPLRSPPATPSTSPVSESPRSVLDLPRQSSSIASIRPSLFSTSFFQQSQSSATSISLSDSTTTYRRRNPFDHSFRDAFSLNNEASSPANEATAPRDEPSAAIDDRSAVPDRDTVDQHKPWYRRWGKMTTTIVAMAAFLLAIFSAVIGWLSFNIAKDALQLQADAVHIAAQQAAFQEWSVYKTFWDSCIAFGNTSVVNKYCMRYIVNKPLLPPLVNETYYYGASQLSRRQLQDELPDTDDLPHFPILAIAICLLPMLFVIVIWLMVWWVIFEEFLLIQEFTLIWLAVWCAIVPTFPTPQETWVRKWLGSSRWDGLYLLTLTSILVGMVRLWEKYMKSRRMSLSVEIPVWTIASFGFPLIYISFYETIDKGGDLERTFGYRLRPVN